MHFHCEIVIPEDGDVTEAVERAMAPFRDTESEGQARPAFDFDWYQIGGRYTGSKSDYDPATDPQNIETCRLCNGTGQRSDPLGLAAREKNPAYSCNGCDGAGTCTKWPTQWASHAGDIIPVSATPDTLRAYTLILPNGTVLVQENWNGEKWEKTGFDGNVLAALRAHDINNGRLVTVDYHS